MSYSPNSSPYSSQSRSPSSSVSSTSSPASSYSSRSDGYVSAEVVFSPPELPPISTSPYYFALDDLPQASRQAPRRIPASHYMTPAVDPTKPKPRMRSSSFQRTYQPCSFPSGHPAHAAAAAALKRELLHHPKDRQTTSASASVSPKRASTRSRTKSHSEPKFQLAPVPTLPPGPTNHVGLPQPVFCDWSLNESGKFTTVADPYFRHLPITFQTPDFPEMGVKLGNVLRRASPDIVGGGDKVLDLGDKQIKIKILWPGYPAEAFEKRMRTHHGTVTRDVLLMTVANAVFEFVTHMQKLRTPVQPGYEEWAIGTLPDGSEGIIASEVFITALLHRGGANWQPELWVPRNMRC